MVAELQDVDPTIAVPCARKDINGDEELGMDSDAMWSVWQAMYEQNNGREPLMYVQSVFDGDVEVKKSSSASNIANAQLCSSLQP